MPRIIVAITLLLAFGLLLGCAGFGTSTGLPDRATPLTTSASLGQGDARRDASLQLVIAGLDEDAAGRPGGALARYERAVRVDATNPFAYLAQAGDPGRAEAFLDQARALFEAQGSLGPEVDVWGMGLRAGIERALGRDDQAERYLDAARALSPEIWGDEQLSAEELR
jgi:tetratricopeptide (TPR) repeat protein